MAFCHLTNFPISLPASFATETGGQILLHEIYLEEDDRKTERITKRSKIEIKKEE